MVTFVNSLKEPSLLQALRGAFAAPGDAPEGQIKGLAAGLRERMYTAHINTIRASIIGTGF